MVGHYRVHYDTLTFLPNFTYTNKDSVSVASNPSHSSSTTTPQHAYLVISESEYELVWLFSGQTAGILRLERDRFGRNVLLNEREHPTGKDVLRFEHVP